MQLFGPIITIAPFGERRAARAHSAIQLSVRGPAKFPIVFQCGLISRIGDRPDNFKGSGTDFLKLDVLGVTKKQSHNWQKLADDNAFKLAGAGLCSPCFQNAAWPLCFSVSQN